MSNHLKAYAAPKSWTFLRKTNKWTARPNPGAHKMEKTEPIILLLKQLGFANTAREVKNILRNKAVSVDRKTVCDPHFGIGFMDTVNIKPKTHLRCLFDQKGRLTFKPITENESTKKLCKIVGKRTVKDSKIQLNFSDGRNMLVEKGSYAVGDSVLLELPTQKILDHFPLKTGNSAFLLAGRHTGLICTVEKIEGAKIHCKHDKQTLETLKQFAFIIGKDKPAVTL